MIPVTDQVGRRSFPFVNLAIIIANFAVFVYELSLSNTGIADFFRDYGVVPEDISSWVEDPSLNDEEPFTVVSAAFIHGGWLHVLGNMLYLWVFGDNVEDTIGHVKYIVFYLAAAVAAVALQVAIDTDETIPMVGASGAIAGVLGGYLVLYPRATIGVVIPWFWFFGAFPLPAFVMIGFWFILQLFSGLATIGGDTLAEQEAVAFWAHVGGFIAGFVIVLLMRPFVNIRPAVTRRRVRDLNW